MSYKIFRPQPQITYAHELPLMPLAQVPPPITPLATGPSDATKKLIIAVVVIVLILIALAWLNKRQTTMRRNPVKQLSTAELAQKLYERLERRGGAGKATMQALKSYASQKA